MDIDGRYAARRVAGGPGWALGLGSLLAWEVFGRLYAAPLLFPWPSHIVTVSLPSLAVFGGAAQPDIGAALLTLGWNLAVTLWRIVLGITIGTVAGFVVGVGAFVLGRRCAGEPILLVLLRSLPLFGLIPLFVLWFAGRESGVWAYIGFSSAVVVATGVHQAIANVPRGYLLQARLQGATPSQRFSTVVLPAITPELLGTARNVLGLAWAFSLGAEYTASRDGLGHLVYLSYTYADMGKIAALASVYCASGLLVFFVWTRWSVRWAHWSQSTYMEGKA